MMKSHPEGRLIGESTVANLFRSTCGTGYFLIFSDNEKSRTFHTVREGNDILGERLNNGKGPEVPAEKEISVDNFSKALTMLHTSEVPRIVKPEAAYA